MEYQIRQSVQQFLVIGVSHKTCPVGSREKFHLAEDEKEQLILEAKKQGVGSLIPVSTCNRTEVYAYSEDIDLITYLFKKYSRASLEEIISHCYMFKGQTAIKHIFSVACGLDSQILGELEISGQLKQAFQEAYDLGMVNTFSDRLIQHVNKASKKIKTKTNLSKGAASTSRAAVQFLRKHVENLRESSVLLYGVGEIGKNTCDNLLKYIKPQQLTVINRTREKAEQFARAYECHFGYHENLSDHVHNSDVIIVATGAPNPTVTQEELTNTGRLRNAIVMDLSVPRNVDSNVAGKVNKLISIDELEEQNAAVLKTRQESVPKATEIIEKQMDEFYNWLKISCLSPVFSGFQEYLQSVKQKEVNRYKDMIPVNDMDHIEEITDNIINKISRQCISYLRENNSNNHTPAEVITSMFSLQNK